MLNKNLSMPTDEGDSIRGKRWARYFISCCMQHLRGIKGMYVKRRRNRRYRDANASI